MTNDHLGFAQREIERLDKEIESLQAGIESLREAINRNKETKLAWNTIARNTAGEFQFASNENEATPMANDRLGFAQREIERLDKEIETLQAGIESLREAINRNVETKQAWNIIARNSAGESHIALVEKKAASARNEPEDAGENVYRDEEQDREKPAKKEEKSKAKAHQISAFAHRHEEVPALPESVHALPEAVNAPTESVDALPENVFAHQEENHPLPEPESVHAQPEAAYAPTESVDALPENVFAHQEEDHLPTENVNAQQEEGVVALLEGVHVWNFDAIRDALNSYGKGLIPADIWRRIGSVARGDEQFQGLGLR